MRWILKDSPLWLRFIFAVVLVAAAAAFRAVFLSRLGIESPFVTFYPAVAISALLGGLIPGILATIASIFVADYFWMEPIGFGVSSQTDWVILIVFGACGTIISGISEAMHRAETRARTAEKESKLAVEREKAAGALRESEELASRQWKLTFDSVPDLIMIVDPDHRIVRVNRAMAERLGMSPDECIGLPCFKSVHDLTEPPLFCPHSHTLKDGKEHIVEAHEERLGGDFLISTSPVFDEQGKLVGSVHVARDITERKLMEKELRKSRDELALRVEERTAELARSAEVLREKASLLDLAHDAIIVRDEDGRIIFWNSGAVRTYGFSREEALRQNVHQLLQTRSPVPFEEIATHIRDHSEWRGELIHTNSSGDKVFVESRWALKTGTSGEPAGYLEINRDITPRKKTEELYRRADRAFRTLSECNQALVHAQDESELLHSICKIIIEIGGYLMAWVGIAEHDENKSVRPVASCGYDAGYLDCANISWADVERGRGPVGRAIRAGKPYVLQYTPSNPDFEPWREEALRRGYASCASFPLTSGGQIFGALTIYAPEQDAFNDAELKFFESLAENLSYGINAIRVSVERRRSEEELKSYSKKLVLVNQELQDFASIASHDLQEPLRKILSFGEMLSKHAQDKLDETEMEYLLRMTGAANRMERLLKDLLDYSRVTTRAKPLKPVNLRDVVTEAIEVFELAIKQSSGRVEIADLPVINADISQMSQLFQNLLGNAIKYCDGIPEIRIYGETGNGFCRIFVKDNGIGFDEKYLDKIFAPFQRLHGRNSKYKGSGMGLAICRKIVERHGGSITAKSKPGDGSTFIVSLPCKSA